TMPVKSIQINLFNNDEVRAPMGIISKPIIVSQFVEPQTEPHIRAGKHDGIRVGCLLQKSDGGRKASPIAIQLDLPDNATDLKLYQSGDQRGDKPAGNKAPRPKPVNPNSQTSRVNGYNMDQVCGEFLAV